MEEIILSIDDHRILKKNKLKLEAHFGVTIKLPEIKENALHSNDIFAASIFGASKNRSYVTKFLEKKRNKLMQARAARSSSKGNIPVVILSESDSETAVLAETQNRKKRKRKLIVKEKEGKYCQSIVNFCPTKRGNSNECHLVSNFHEPEFKKESLSSPAEYQCVTDIANKNATEKDDSILVLSEYVNPQPVHPVSGIAKGLPIESSPERTDDTQVIDDSIIILSEDIHVPSHTCAPSTSYQGTNIPIKSVSKNADDSIVILTDDTPLPAAPEFIPLRTSRYAVKKKNKRKRRDSDDTLSCEVPRPNLKERRVLRPVVIDGSNVAREHGKIQNTFSCKGIKITIEYFLKRGHTQVTALLPHFRKYCKYDIIPTTDQHLLEELERSQRVVFTPSRRVHGKMITCYDDRFIVNLASQTEGVIVSNDNYRDIIDESPQFKKTIEERLLMYCFVGDIIMIPEDPLGRHGPKLDTFLSMKESISEETQSNSSQVNNQLFANQFFRNINAPTT